MISFNRTYDETRAIRVLVVPIGDNSMFDKHFEIVSRIRKLPVFDLNRPSEWKPQDSSFKNFNWNSSSSDVLFDYLRYDRVANGPSDLENFQCSRRILIVIGVINFPEIQSVSSSRLEEDMDYYTRRHPHVILKRYFVFNYFAAAALAPPSAPPSLPFSEDSETRDPYAVVVFPPDGECEGGSMLDVHTKEIIGNISVRLFQALDGQMRACEELRGKVTGGSTPVLPSWLPLSTIFDDMEDSSGGASAGDVSRRMKKRLPGRLRKWMGDLCMQVYSPIDAWDHYVVAINESRSQSDAMWLAGALEGSVVAILALLRLGAEVEEELPVLVKEIRSLLASGSVSSTTAAVVKVSEDRCVEALSLYSKNIAWCILEVECCLRLGRVHEMLNSSPADKQQKVMEYLLRAASVPGLNVAQQIECTVEGAFICLRMNMRRKYAFLLYFAALLSADSENASVAHSLIRSACQHYGVQLTEQSPSGSVDVIQVDNPRKSWASMRRVLFAHSAHFAKEFGDAPTTAKCLAALLRLVGEMEDNRYKHKKYWVGDLALEMNADDFSWTVEGTNGKAGKDEAGGMRPSSVRWKDVVATSISGGKNLHHIHNAAAQKLTALYHLSSETLTRASISDESGSGRSYSTAAPASGGMSEHYSGFKAGRSFSTFGHSSTTASLASLSHVFRSHPGGDGTSSDFGALDDDGTEGSESSHNGGVNLTPVKNSTDLGKPLRGHVSVPKISPYVQNLISRRRKHNSSSGQRTPDVHQRHLTSGGNTEGSSAPAPLTPEVDVSKATSTSSTSPYPPTPPSKGASLITPPPTISGADPSLHLGVPFELQKQSVNALSLLCEELPPATPLLLEGLPYLLRVSPLPGLEENTPQPLKVTPYFAYRGDSGEEEGPAVPGVPSALFYDPFEAKRARDRNRSSATSILWSQGCIAHIEAMFCNPLAVPLHLHDVHALVEGVEHTAYPVKTATVPPETEEFRLVLSLSPRGTGSLTIKGVRYSLFNAVHTSLVDPTTGIGIHGLANEISSPWKYPRRVVGDVLQRRPPCLRSPVNGRSSSAAKIDKKSADIRGDSKTNSRKDISVVPELSTIGLWASWGSGVEHSPMTTSSSEAEPPQPPLQNEALTGNAPLSIFLFENEIRRERVRISNNSSSSKILDVRITVHCRLTRPETVSSSKINTKMSYTLIPFSTLCVAPQSLGPPVLPPAIFESTDETNGHMKGPLFPFLVRVVTLKNLNGGDVIPLLPRQSCELELEFSSYHSQSLSPSATFEFRVDVEYITEFPGVENYLKSSVESDLAESKKEPSEIKEDTIFSKRSFIVNEVVMVSSIKMENIVPLNQISSEIVRGVRQGLMPVHIQYPFLPESVDDEASLRALDTIASCLRSLGISFSKLGQQSSEQTEGSPSSSSGADAGKRQGLRLREVSSDGGLLLSGGGLMVACFDDSRVFSVKVTNNSAFHVLISGRVGSDGQDCLWKYTFPAVSGAGDMSTGKSVLLAPLHSANILLSISEDALRGFLKEQVKSTDCTYAEARLKLADTVSFRWRIVDPAGERVDDLSCGTRRGELTLLSVNKSWANALKLSRFSMAVEFPSSVQGKEADSKIPTALLKNISPHVQLRRREFHRFAVQLTDIAPLEVGSCETDRRHIEVAFVVTNASSSDPAPQNGVRNIHCPSSVIITGSVHKILAVPSEGVSASSQDDSYHPLRHEISMCFTRCGLYRVFTFARFRSRSNTMPSESDGRDGESSPSQVNECVSAWWTLKEPVTAAIQ